MKKFLIAVLLTITIVSFNACSSDDIKVEEPTLDQLLQAQDEEYDKLKSILPGHWVAYEQYNNSDYGEPGWQPISKEYWQICYTFKSDGTFITHKSVLDLSGTYRLVKNPEYPDNKTVCKVILCYTEQFSNKERKRVVWLDGDYLRLGDSDFAGGVFVSIIPANFNCKGEEGIRYKRE